ncbi:MAG: xylan 1,4-beta-xylosidase [Lachnospiraceae bacterium]|nr:xylan 1,4-beta-xylosidase [Lachnospiraceae bacterium]
MAEEARRFKRVFAEGKKNVSEIWVDRMTGVNYLYHYETHMSGVTGGLTPLLDADGKPVVTPITD